MNLLKMTKTAVSVASSIANFSGGIQKVAFATQTKVQKTPVKSANALSKATGAINSVNDILQKTSDVADKSLKTFDKLCETRDKFTKHIAKSQINNTLGINKASTIEGQKEILRKEMIDPKFSTVQNLFKRVKDTFIPSTFPSGKKVPLGKPQINEIAYNMEKKQTTKISFKNNDGDEFIFNVKAKPVEIYHEPAYVTTFKHKSSSGNCESVKSLYFPQSAEIRSINTSYDGKKVLTVVTGNDNGGIVKQIKK